MAAKPIGLARLPALPASLAMVRVDPATLFRVSGHDTGEPYFGKWNANRFDDPCVAPTARYGTCYLGTSLGVAIAETVLHDRRPTKGWFVVELAVIKSRYVVQFSGAALALADLTGAHLRRIGGHAGLTGTSSYATTKKWSATIHAHPDKVDGFIYMSRHKNDEKAIVLFDRAGHKLRMISATPLYKHPDFGQVATALYIRSSMP